MVFPFKALKPTTFLTSSLPSRLRCYSSQKPFKPLRILFCGADEFSIHSLRALHALQSSHLNYISSIDVVCRPDKPTGRRRQQLREVPIKPLTQSLSLPLHQLDTFTNWSPPPTDLVITVSFGLLVPARILQASTHGGLNIHPSLLPDLRGPAPIQHALLLNRPSTGVSLQTMHPTKFDRGAVLAQRSVNVPEDATVEGLVDVLGRMGAEMLVAGIQEGLFIEPEGINISTSGEDVQHAPKITPRDRHIADWTKVSAGEILRRDRVLGRLWDEGSYSLCCGGTTGKRVTFHGGWKRFRGEDVQIERRLMWSGGHEGGVVVFRIPGVKGVHFGVEMSGEGGVVLAPSEATIEGEKKGSGLDVLMNGIMARS